MLPTAKPLEIYSDLEILTNPILSRFNVSNCLNPNCSINLESQFENVYKNQNTEIRGFFAIDFDELKQILINRRERINQMINSLSQNIPDEGTNNEKIFATKSRTVATKSRTVASKSKAVETKSQKTINKVDIVLQIILHEGYIHKSNLILPKNTSGKDITNTLLQDPEISQYLNKREFNIYLSNEIDEYKKGERIYDDMMPINLNEYKCLTYEDNYKKPVMKMMNWG